MPIMAIMSMVLVTPAERELNVCSLRRVAPEHILKPGISKTPARMEPIMEPSTRLALASVSAML